MSQKLQVMVKGKPGQFTPGEKYKVIFGEGTPDRVPYLFHCMRLCRKIDAKTWEWAGIGEFDDRILEVMARHGKDT